MPDIVVMSFLLGMVAGLVRSDLAIPKAAFDTLSLLLILSHRLLAIRQCIGRACAEPRKMAFMKITFRPSR